MDTYSFVSESESNPDGVVLAPRQWNARTASVAVVYHAWALHDEVSCLELSSSRHRRAPSNMQTAERLRIAVVGGGICGLACAVALAKEGIHAEIFEAAVRIASLISLDFVLIDDGTTQPSFGEIGAGVGFGMLLCLAFRVAT